MRRPDHERTGSELQIPCEKMPSNLIALCNKTQKKRLIDCDNVERGDEENGNFRG